MTVGRRMRQHLTEQFSPTSITGLHSWYEAGSLNLADGTAVSSWTDISGNGHDAVQATGSKQPIYKVNIAGGRPVIRFDGSDDFLATAAYGADLAQPNTIIVVVRHATITATRFVFDGQGSTKRHAMYHDNAATNFRIYAGGTATSQTRDTNWNVRTGLYNGASSLASKNGSTTAASVGTQAIAGLNIGAEYDNIGTLDGDIAELLVYHAALSTTDRQTLERWLGAKYGIAVV